jgi:hypothetical protein
MGQQRSARFRSGQPGNRHAHKDAPQMQCPALLQGTTCSACSHAAQPPAAPLPIPWMAPHRCRPHRAHSRQLWNSPRHYCKMRSSCTCAAAVTPGSCVTPKIGEHTSATAQGKSMEKHKKQRQQSPSTMAANLNNKASRRPERHGTNTTPGTAHRAPTTAPRAPLHTRAPSRAASNPPKPAAPTGGWPAPRVTASQFTVCHPAHQPSTHAATLPTNPA